MPFVIIYCSAGLTKAENLIVSCHPSDKINLDAFKVSNLKLDISEILFTNNRFHFVTRN